MRRADRPIASNMKDPLQRLFLREKPSLAVLALSEMEPAYAAQIAKHIDSGCWCGFVFDSLVCCFVVIEEEDV